MSEKSTHPLLWEEQDEVRVNRKYPRKLPLNISDKSMLRHQKPMLMIWTGKNSERTPDIVHNDLFPQDKPLYVDDDKDVMNILYRHSTKPAKRLLYSYDGTMGAKEDTSGTAKAKYEVKPHVAVQESTRIDIPPKGTPESDKKANGDDVVTGVWDGVGVAFEESKLTWSNLIKNIQKMTTSDEDKRQKIEQELGEIEKKYDALPATSGAATVSSAITNIVGVGLPTVIAGLFAGPEIATAAGVSMIGADLLSTISQADMEMDSYERKTGKKLTENQRVAYTVALTATDLIMGTMLSRGLLNGVTKSTQRELSKQIAKRIYDSPVAQEEFNTMTRRVLQHEQKKRIEGAVSAGVEGALSSGAMEAERSIYTQEAPELENIVLSSFGGLVAGTTQSAIPAKIHKDRLHKDRMESDNIHYVSDMDNKGNAGTPMSEIVFTANPISHDGVTEKVRGEIVSPGMIGGISREYDVDNVVSGSYREAMKDPMVHKKYEDMQVPVDHAKEYQKQWELSKTKKNTEEMFAMQNEVVQRIAADMGLPIQVYARYDDLPADVAKIARKSDYPAITVNNNGCAIVLEPCQGLNVRNIEAIIRHEVLGHKGMKRTYQDEKSYYKDLDKAGRELIENEIKKNKKIIVRKEALREGAEERGARKTEIRSYSPTGKADESQTPDHNYKTLYKMLRRSEDAARKSTVNELRKGSNRIGGNPMPQLFYLYPQDGFIDIEE